MFVILSPNRVKSAFKQLSIRMSSLFVRALTFFTHGLDKV